MKVLPYGFSSSQKNSPPWRKNIGMWKSVLSWERKEKTGLWIFLFEFLITISVVFNRVTQTWWDIVDKVLLIEIFPRGMKQVAMTICEYESWEVSKISVHNQHFSKTRIQTQEKSSRNFSSKKDRESMFETLMKENGGNVFVKNEIVFEELCLKKHFFQFLHKKESRDEQMKTYVFCLQNRSFSGRDLLIEPFMQKVKHGIFAESKVHKPWSVYFFSTLGILRLLKEGHNNIERIFSW